MDFINKAISDAINNFFKSLVDSAIQMFLKILTDIMGMASNILDMPVVSKAILLSQAIAISFVAVKVAYDALMTYMLRVSGDPDSDPKGLLFNTVKSVAIIATMPWLIKYIYSFGTSLATDISKLPGVDYSKSSTIMTPFQQLVQQVTAQAYSPILTGAGIIFALVMFLIIILQTFIKSAELAIVGGVGALMATGLTNAGSQMFATWFRKTLSISLSQAIRIYMLKVAFYSLTFFNNGNPLASLCLFIALLYVTYKSPTILEEFIYSTGLSRVAGGAAQQMGSAYLMRKMIMKW